jgi:hypothetical protein
VPTATGHRLPGITYEVVPPQLPDTLPRMDVAGFVGFASTGPVDVPVVVEDVAGFREVFGPDVPLARDHTSGGWRHAHLGPSVEEFLRNGGRRCWVVRVADTGAAAARFPAAGVLDVTGPAEAWRTAQLVARAVGDWADGLKVATALRSTRLPPVEVVADAPRVRLDARVAVRVGDLLRVTVDGGRRTLLLAVADAARAPDGATELTWDRQLVLEPDGDPDAPEHRPVVSGAAWLITAAGGVALGEVDATALGADDRVVELEPTDDASTAVPPGALLRIEPEGAAGAVLVAPVRGLAPGGRGTVIGPCQWIAAEPPVAPAGTTLLPLPGEADVEGGDEPASVDGAATAGLVVERLTLTLAVYEDERLRARVDDLAFDARHPDHWGALPTDDEMYGVRARAAGADGRGPRPVGSADSRLAPLWERVSSPRFPVAAAPGSGGTWFPVGVADLTTSDGALPTVSDTSPAARRQRSGVETFDPSVFGDPDLWRVPPGGIATAIDTRANAVDTRANATDRLSLRGVHALFPIGEVTLVAIPDAGHPGWWVRTQRREPPPEAPNLLPPEHADGVVLWWAPSGAGHGRYVLEEAETFDLTAPAVRLDGRAPLEGGPDQSVGLRLASTACRTRRVFRVRAVAADGRTSPWSNTVTVVDPPSTFVDTVDAALPGPLLSLASLDDAPTGRARGRLRWSTPDEHGLDASVRVEVVWSRDPVFATSDRHDHGGADEHDVPAAGDHHVFHRARFVDDPTGRVGPWSTTVVQHAGPHELLELLDPAVQEGPDPALETHRMLLRFAAGRGDVLALLSLPDHFREHDTLAHLARLRGAESVDGGAGTLPPLGPPDDRLLEHAAVFAPWLSVRSPGGVRTLPPDGAVAGVMAHRAVERGAWISPGNRPLEGVVALGGELAAADRAVLAAGGVNLLARLPHGVVATSASTLGTDPVTQPIEVRRLLHLLRRLALRHGDTFVFEPHGHRFRSKVRRRFQRLLGQLYERGAFAGATPQEGFEVVADRSVNPPGSVERGRFVVELRVAPTRPMVFVRVRLVQTGPGDAVAVEVVP